MLKLWRLLYSLPLQWRSLRSRDQVERELDEELRFYLDQRIAHEIAQGQSPQQARTIAMRELGSIEQRKDECRDHRGTQWIENFFADLRHGIRSWRKTPIIWALAAVTLGLGIGANATVISVVDKVWSRPLADLDANSDVVLQSIRPNEGSRQNGTTLDDFLAWRSAPVFDLLSTHKAVEHVISGQSAAERIGEAERILGQAVSPHFYSLLNIRQALGRFPVEAEHQPGAAKLLVLTYDFWQDRFAGNPAILGSTIRLDDARYTVIGIAAKGHWFPSVNIKFWTPLILSATANSHKEGGLQVIGRLKPGITRQQAAAALAPLSAGLERRFPDTHSKAQVQVKKLFDGFYSQEDGRIMAILFLVSAGVLLISCANVANLLMVRGLARRREMTIRIALGAAKSRLLAQSFTEGLVLALPALALALITAGWSSNLLLSRVRVPFPVEGPILEERFLLINTLIALGSVFLFSLFPLWAATGIQGDSIQGDKESRATLGRAAQFITRSLVVIQVALGLALVMTAIVGVRGVQVFTEISPGYDRSQVLRAEYFASLRASASNQMIQQTHQRLLDATAASPQFEAVGLISPVPASNSGDGIRTTIAAPGQTLSVKDSPTAHYVVASPGALETLRIPLIRGRSFSNSDTATSPRVALLNQKLSEQLFAATDPIGQSIRVAELGSESFEIVGIYPNLQSDNIVLGPIPQFFVPFDQAPRRSMQWVGRMRDEKAAMDSLRALAREIDPNTPIQMETLTRNHAESLQNGRVLNSLLATFATLALFFGGCGLFAVVSQTVTQRLPEIGLRMALGASTGNIQRLVLANGFRLLALGSILGLGTGLLLGGLLSKQLLRVTPFDWQVILPSALTFLAVGLAACIAPSLRAARTDVTRVLRQD